MTPQPLSDRLSSSARLALRVIAATAALIAAHFVALLAAALTERWLDRVPGALPPALTLSGAATAAQQSDDSRKRSVVFSAISSAVYWLVLAALALAILSVAGVKSAAVMALLGSVLLAVGLGMQGTLGDLAAGIMVLVAGTYRIGDFISIDESNVSGTVTNFNVLYTSLTDEDTGVSVVLPNRMVYGAVLTNHSTAQKNIALVEVSVSNSNRHLQRAMEAVAEAVQGHPAVLAAPPATCAVAGVGALATTLEVRFAMLPSDYMVNGTTSKVAEVVTLIRRTLVAQGVQLSTPGATSAAVMAAGGKAPATS